MGKEKTSGTTVVNQTTQTTPTAEETALNQRNLRIAQATEPGETTAQVSSLNLINQLLTGQLPSGELFKQIGGIDPNTIATQATELTRQNLPGFQTQGLLDSGVMQRETARNIAQQLLYPAAQFNVGAGQNLLNLALSGQAQVQAPVQANVNQLGAQLAGLRSINTQETTNTTRYSMNPFLKSFQSSSGELMAKAPWAVLGAMCWVASEIFGGWYEPKTCMARHYIENIGPKWFKRFYIKYGKRIAKFIHNKPIFKLILRPLFEIFAYMGREELCLSY